MCPAGTHVAAVRDERFPAQENRRRITHTEGSQSLNLRVGSAAEVAESDRASMSICGRKSRAASSREAIRLSLASNSGRLAAGRVKPAACACPPKRVNKSAHLPMAPGDVELRYAAAAAVAYLFSQLHHDGRVIKLIAQPACHQPQYAPGIASIARDENGRNPSAENLLPCMSHSGGW